MDTHLAMHVELLKIFLELLTIHQIIGLWRLELMFEGEVFV